MTTIHERIRAQRKNAALTQVELAKMVGVARVSLTQWESGDTSPKGENLMKVARALGVTPDWLVSGRGDPSAQELEPAPRGLFHALILPLPARPQSVNGVRFGQHVAFPTKSY